MRQTTMSILFLVMLAGCRHGPITSGEFRAPGDGSPSISVNPITAMEAPQPSPQGGAAVAPTPSTEGMNPVAVTKAVAVFEAVASHDDKKAKLAYGRASRNLPELVQFALDLRFENFEHARTLVDKLPWTEIQRSFWRSVVESKPRHWAQAVCTRLNSFTEYPPQNPAPTRLDLQWDDLFLDAVRRVADKEEEKATNASFDEKLSAIQCNEKESKPKTGYCGPLSEDLKKQFLTDDFFDKLHNAKRRDSRYVRENYKTPAKIAKYRQRAFIKDLKSLLLLFRSVNATEYDRQAHFLRRFRGIGRDMKWESLLNRALGDLFDENLKDQEFTYLLLRFKDENQLIVDINRLDYDLAANCQAKR